jgi:hypothetical protein
VAGPGCAPRCSASDSRHESWPPAPPHRSRAVPRPAQARPGPPRPAQARPGPLDRDALPQPSRRFILELDPVLDPPHPCVRPSSCLACLACLACHACHDASLSCAHSFVAGGGLSLQLASLQTPPSSGAVTPAKKTSPSRHICEISYR